MPANTTILTIMSQISIYYIFQEDANQIKPQKASNSYSRVSLKKTIPKNINWNHKSFSRSLSAFPIYIFQGNSGLELFTRESIDNDSMGLKAKIASE